MLEPTIQHISHKPHSRPRITMRIVDWWEEDNEQNFYANSFIKILQSRFDITYAEDPDFLLYSVFGREHLHFSCPRIFYTGENIRTNWNFADYALDFDFMEFGERHLYFSLFWLFTSDLILASQKHLHAERFAASKDRFCAFLVSNPDGDPIRKNLFHAIHAYKRIDSAGKWLNNTPPIGGRDTDFAQTKRRWLASYRFNLCPENSSHKGYLTEKIIQAHASGCIPIYWGDETLCDPRYDSYRPTLNPKALINVHDYPTLDALVEAIKRIEEDKNLYRAMLKEPAFLPSDKWGIQWGGGLEQNHSMFERARLEVLEFFSAIFTSPTPKQIRFSQRLLAERKDLAILERRRNLYLTLTLPLRALKNPKHYLRRLKEKLGF